LELETIDFKYVFDTLGVSVIKLFCTAFPVGQSFWWGEPSIQPLRINCV